MWESKGIGAFMLLGLVLLASGCLENLHAEEGYTTATVSRMFIDYSGTTKGTSGSHYVVVTDKGNFEIDRPWRDSFNPAANSDLLWAQVKEGRTYRFHHYGYRFDFMYEYPMIVGAEEIGQVANGTQ